MAISAPFPPHRPLARIAWPIAGGACIAVAATVCLSQSFLWTAAALGAGVVLIPSMVVKDRMAYWLSLFLLILPFDISKWFMNPDRAIDFVQQFGAPSGPVGPNLHVIDLAFLPLLVLWLARKLRHREPLYFPRISYVPVAFLCFTAVTAAVAPSPYLAFLAWIKQLRYFIIYVVAVDAIDVRQFGKTILAVLLVTMTLQGGLTLARYELQYFKPFFGDALGRLPADVLGEAEGTRNVVQGDVRSAERGFGTFFHANMTSMHLEFLLPFALTLALSPGPWRWRALYGAALAVGTAGLYATFSRAGLVAFLASVLACIVVALARDVIPRQARAPLVVLGLIAGLILAPVVAAYMSTRPESTADHLEHLEQGLAVARNYPVFGIGLNNSGLARSVVASRHLTYEDTQVPIHSGHLQVLAETGVVGFALYTGFFVLIALEAVRRSRSQNFHVRTFAIGVFATLTAICVHLTTDYIGVESLHAMLWLYAGLIVGQRRWAPARERLGSAPR